MTRSTIRIGYPPIGIGFLAVICLMKAVLQVRAIVVLNRILQLAANGPQAFVIPRSPVLLIALLLVTAIGLWFEKSWARWIARAWASIDTILALVVSLGLYGDIPAGFHWNRWGMVFGFLVFSWFSKFRWEQAPAAAIEWNGEDSDEAPDLNFKLAPAYAARSLLWSANELSTANGFETVATRLISRAPVKIGTLPLPTGRIVAMDPMQGAGYERVFEGTTRPGRYPVYLTPAIQPKDEQVFVAYAAIRFNENVPVRWRPASLTRVDQPTIPVDAMASMYTDSAMACYVDAGVLAQCRDGAAVYPTPEKLESFLTEDRLGVVARLRRDDPDCAMALFFTGTGDGVYDSYWGIDEAGETCALVTDFDLNDGTSRNPLLKVQRAEKALGDNA
ncbi:MAG TPA: DUF4241 domain-containing protein [Phycisphaerae bacterium]|nr:DUF4241 domain-containing protein [Phycisphaerae bacterium]HRW55672.1 DUF4241 domain-containing protein [Phycisphaerae bacterium]